MRGKPFAGLERGTKIPSGQMGCSRLKNGADQDDIIEPDQTESLEEK